jgi:hypothetical protein
MCGNLVKGYRIPGPKYGLAHVYIRISDCIQQIKHVVVEIILDSTSHLTFRMLLCQESKTGLCK